MAIVQNAGGNMEFPEPVLKAARDRELQSGETLGSETAEKFKV